MNIKLEKIVIFNIEGEAREVNFSKGLNIITGESKTGKSALLKIIDYCMFSKDTNIPYGVIKEFSYLYVLVFKVNNNYIILGREEANKSNYYLLLKSSDEFKNLSLSDFSRDIVKTDSNAKKLLLKYFGINVDNESSRLKDGLISVRSMIPLLLQPQNVVANGEELFMGFSNQFVKNNTIDDFLFSIKKVDNNYLKLKREISILKKDIRDKKIKNISNADLYEDICNELETKIKDFFDNIGYKSEQDDILSLIEVDFDEVLKKGFNNNLYCEGFNSNALIELENSRLRLSKEVQKINNELSIIDLSLEEFNQFYNTSSGISEMLSELSLFNESDSNRCPLCTSKVEGINIESYGLKNINYLLKEDINNTKAYNNNVEDKKCNLIKRKKELQGKISRINGKINSLKKFNKLDNSIYEKLLILKTEINVLKKSFYSLLKYTQDDSLELDEKRLNELELEFGNINLGDTDSDFINSKLNDIVVRLDIEDIYKDKKLKFDIKSFDLFYENKGESIYIKQIGSGANILALHLSLFLSLLWLSVKNDSYIPKFIFIDQPSQVYFPENKRDSETREELNIYLNDKDRKEVENFLIVILDELNKMKDEFGYVPQVIINEHANNLNLGKYNFNDYVIENWRETSIRQALI